MADARELVNRIRGNIYKLRSENFPISQEITLIKQIEGWAKELHANQLVKDLENYRIFYLEEYQALKGKGTLNAAKLDLERQRVLMVALGHLAKISV